jgi:hypothetical protein
MDRIRHHPRHVPRVYIRELNMNWIFVPVGAYAAAVEWIESHGHTVFWCWVGSFIVAWWL